MDTKGNVYMDMRNGIPVLVMKQQISGATYETLFYHYGNKLYEVFQEQGIEFDDVVPTYSYQLHTLDLDETNIARIFCRGSDGTTFFWIIDTNGNLYIASQTYSKDKENLLR